MIPETPVANFMAFIGSPLAALFSGCITIVASSMFVSEILYVNNETTVVFWTLWGFLIYFIYKNCEKNDRGILTQQNDHKRMLEIFGAV